MAEALLLTVVRGVAEKAADALVQSVARMWDVDDDRRKLERHLVFVQSWLADAEARSETNHAVRAWMKELKAAAYKADDVLDDFRYEALRREAESGQSMASKVLSNLTSKNRLVFRHKASKDLKKVLDKINRLVAEMNTFGLVVPKEVPKQAPARQTHSVLDESMDIFGRDDDKEVVVKLLLERQDPKDVQVLPIIGMGGVGKTTLAKMVYNNQRIQKHFELKMWHCVSENFEAASLVRSVIELATNSKCDLPATIELLRSRLQEAIGRKRFLLVLDDVWNEDQNKWEDDLKPLLCSSIGRSGSMIVVTSRSPQVASIMGTLPPHELACLSEDDSWELFSRKAFSKGVQKQEDFERIGRRISNNCKGLPLALKTMGGLMSSNPHAHEWEVIADCNISQTSRGKDEVLPILKLSYNYLSSEMKQCFAFCAIFPKDFEMEKDMLIQLWTANGYIHEEGTMDFAQKGEFVFKELVWRCFLQEVIIERRRYYFSFRDCTHSSKATKEEVNGCKMHDLMHDLAKSAADECATAEDLIQRNVSISDICHLQILQDDEPDKIIQLSRGTIYLRTLLAPSSCGKDLRKSKLTSLRALHFCARNTSIVHRQLTRTAHLRYLDLSYSMVVSLPNSICMLYNLQSLRLNYCYYLEYLPEGISTMRNLSHIYLVRCDSLKHMPSKLSLLHNLRTLTRFVVETNDGCGIEELEGMRQLGNRLELYNLQKVKDGSKANLHEKQNLNELVLCWGSSCTEKPTTNVPKQELALESLVPHGELKTLEIHGYGGLTIPQWMKNPQLFQCLRELIMNGCQGCKDLPIVWLSSSLECFSLFNMESLTTLCKGINVKAEAYNVSLQIFPKLKRMELTNLPELERWAETTAGDNLNSLVTFPSLKELIINNCDKLASLPEMPVVTDLHVSYQKRNTGSLVSMHMPLSCFSSLVNLRIGLQLDVVMPPDGEPWQSQKPLDTLRYLQFEGDNSFVSIFDKSKLQLGLRDCFVVMKELFIESCSTIVNWPLEELRFLPRLRYLCIWNCSKLEGKDSSSDFLPLPQLQRLQIQYCDSLLQIPKLPSSLEEVGIFESRNLVALPSNLGDLAKLRSLIVRSCCALEALPDGMDGLTSLEKLNIDDCPGIKKFPQDLLQLLPAVKQLRIFGCPELQRRCREGGEYFELVASIPKNEVSAPRYAPKTTKLVKLLLPSCDGGGSQGN